MDSIMSQVSPDEEKKITIICVVSANHAVFND